MLPTVSALKELEYGLNISPILNAHFFLLHAIFDKPAKGAVLNIVAGKAYYACHVCYQKGKPLNLAKNDDKIVDKNDDINVDKNDTVKEVKQNKGEMTIIYPYDSIDPTGPKRTQDSYDLDLKETLKLKNGNYRGVKGPCCLYQNFCKLKFFKGIIYTCIDYMHSGLEGVCKCLFKYWFDSKYTSCSFSLRKNQIQLDDRLLEIRPPTFVPQPPRSLLSWSQWRANEYLSFILYYSLPVFLNIMDTDQYKNLIRLVIFFEVILSKEINFDKLDLAQNLIQEFVKEINVIYKDNILLTGVHELLHLVECTRKFGPLNLINCFPFEELNRKFLGFIKGKDLIGEEFIKIFSTLQTLCNLNDSFKFTNLQLSEFVKSELNIKSTNKKKLNEDNNCFKLSGYFESNNQTRYTHIIFKGIVYHSDSFNNNSSEISKKRNDSCIFSKEKNKYGIIEYFYIENNRPYAVCKEIILLEKTFFIEDIPELKSELTCCDITKQFFITKCEKMTKKALIKINNTEVYISDFTTSHLFS